MKTNFEKITETPENLSQFIMKQYGYSQVKEDDTYFNLLQWLGWDVEENNSNTVKRDFTQKDIEIYNTVCKELQGDVSDEEMEEIEDYMDNFI